MGVSKKRKEIGAGDQGMMFGYACRQTQELMPLPIMLAHQLAMRLAEVRKKKVLPYLGPDGKTQVTVEYRDGKPVRVDYVVIAASHTAAVVTRDGRFMTEEAKREIIAAVVRPVLGDLLDSKTRFTVNGTGKFLVERAPGGHRADGPKIIVDTYGGWAVHGGGAFSGKDPTKVDRSAGYMASYVAKNVVAAGLADECLLQLGYCIGLVDPVSVMVNTYGTGTLPDEVLSAVVRRRLPALARGHHRPSAAEGAGLPQDRRVRALRPRGVRMGAGGRPGGTAGQGAEERALDRPGPSRDGLTDRPRALYRPSSRSPWCASSHPHKLLMEAWHDRRQSGTTLLPYPDMGGRVLPADARQRPDRGGDRHRHADPAVAGVRAAGGAAGEVGLFASMAPLLLYAIFGTSRTLAVGPVAVVSLMTAAAVAPLAAQGSPEYLGAAIALALVSGLLLLAMGLLRLGFLANFLSHPVVSGFITASGLQIAAEPIRPRAGHPCGG